MPTSDQHQSSKDNYENQVFHDLLETETGSNNSKIDENSITTKQRQLSGNETGGSGKTSSEGSTPASPLLTTRGGFGKRQSSNGVALLSESREEEKVDEVKEESLEPDSPSMLKTSTSDVTDANKVLFQFH
jgi:hypothetical protein